MTILAVLLFAVGSTATSAQPLEVSVHARAVAPGEPVLVVARSTEPVAGVDGTLAGEPLRFVPAGAEARGPARVWMAWAALHLDAKPGPSSVVVSVRGGGEARTDVVVESRSFPESKLEVAEKYVNPPKAAQERIARDNKRLGEVFARRTATQLPSGPFVRPVPGANTGVFGARRVFNGQKRNPHSGLDLKAAVGTPVKSSGSGTVAMAEDTYFSGNTIVVDHGAGLFTVYAHLSEMRVKEGDVVSAGQVIALSGATGRVTGPHLHWGAKAGSRLFDPEALLDPSLFPPGPAG